MKSVGVGLAVVIVTVVAAAIAACQFALSRTARYYGDVTAHEGVALREFPFPYRCALSVCSDIDRTSSLSEFLTIQEFLNTRNRSPLGEGLGLEIGNTFFIEDEEFGFLSPHPADQEVLIDLMKAGYVDTIHSLDRARSRDEIRRAVEALSEAGVSVDVWTNHGDAASNLGPGRGCVGDDYGDAAYHTDFSMDILGYEFVWLDSVSGIVDQGRPISMTSFVDAFDRRHPIRSLFNSSLPEQLKFLLAAAGNDRYSMRLNNELVRVTHLDDGRPVFEFTRSNYCYYGLWEECASAAGLAETLREEVQAKLVREGGYMIVYSHLGKNTGPPYLPQATVDALRSLAERSRAGSVWVTTTSRLLRYYVNKKYLDWDARRDGDTIIIVIHAIRDPVRGVITPDLEALQGITFYVQEPGRTRILLDDQIVETVTNPPDETGRRSITIPLKPLENLDALMQDYKARGYF